MRDESYPQVLPEGFTNHWSEGVLEADYHADKTAVSSTSLRHALRSPLHFLEFSVRGDSSPENDAMRFGTLVHCAILEPEKFRGTYIEMPDFGDMRSPKNREKKAAWLSDLPEGAQPMDQEQIEGLNRILASIQAYQHPDTGEKIIVNLLKDSAFEATGYFRDDVTGLRCKIRVDALKHDYSAIIDVKTTRDPSRHFFAREIWNRRYATQIAFYMLGVEKITGVKPRFPCFLALQNEPPYDIAVWEADEAMIERGFLEVRHGLDLIKKCMDAGHWPGVQPGLAEIISLPGFTDAIGILD